MKAEWGFYIALSYSLVSLVVSYVVDIRLCVFEEQEDNSHEDKDAIDEHAVLISTKSKHAYTSNSY